MGQFSGRLVLLKLLLNYYKRKLYTFTNIEVLFWFLGFDLTHVTNCGKRPIAE